MERNSPSRTGRLDGCDRNEKVSQGNGPFGTFDAVTVDRRPKALLKALTEMYGGESGK
jgi:hypothetical protein